MIGKSKQRKQVSSTAKPQFKEKKRKKEAEINPLEKKSISLMPLTKPPLYVPVISENGLENLRKYAYHGVDNSLCARLFLNSFWERVVALMPQWLAPNLITLAGGAFCAAATLLAMLLAPTYTEHVPGWACFVYAACIFAYQTMDNIDGKQARRTGAGSPLGELFDHGVDSLVMGMFVMIVASVLGAGGVYTVVAGVLILGPFYLSHWDEYHAGVLVMGELTGPTEMQVAVMAFLAVVGVLGGRVPAAVAPFVLVAAALGALAMCGMYVRSVHKLVTEGRSVHPVARFGDALRQVLPYAAWVGTTLVWVVATHATAAQHPTLYLLAITLAFGAMTQQLIAQRICGEPISFNWNILVPYAIAAVYGVLSAAGLPFFVGPTTVLFFVFIASFFLEAVFVSSVIYQLATFLEIHPFRITPRK